MAKISKARGKADAVAIASKGRVTSQIETQSSEDKPVPISSLEEV